jgi:hypothetical protein
MSVQRTFAQTIETLRKGRLADELDKALHQLVLAVDENKGGGSITLTITIKPSKTGALEIFDKVAVKEPAEDRSSTLLFATPEGHLQRSDPRQGELDGIREVPADNRPARRAS